MMPPYPNPTTGKLILGVSTMEGGEANLQVMDLFGKVLYKSNRELTVGINPLELDLQQLPKGVYLIECSLSQYGFVKMEKVVLQ